ncbi:hypothetical protein PG984_002666 [Apiospora sp. TS-2023a]
MKKPVFTSPPQLHTKAVAYVLEDGRSIDWNACRLIWDSADVVDDSHEHKESDRLTVCLSCGFVKMAIRGVMGNLQSRENKPMRFRIEHEFDFGTQTYQLHARVSNHEGKIEEELFRPDSLPDREESFFQSAVRGLTSQFRSTDAGSTIVSFMTLKKEESINNDQ